MRVLLVDDDPFALNLLAHQLTLTGMDDAHTSNSAQSALEHYNPPLRTILEASLAMARQLPLAAMSA